MFVYTCDLDLITFYDQLVFVLRQNNLTYWSFDLPADKIPCYTASSSIPTKYQRVVITNQEKKGFSSQAKRFPSDICLVGNLTYIHVLC